MRAPRRTCRSLEVWTVSLERTSPRGYAFFVPLGGGERPFGITPTFARQRYYSKIAANQRGGQGRYGQNAGMGSAGRGGFRRRNGDSSPYFRQLSAVLQATLRHTLTQVRRRVSPSRAERDSIWGRRQGRPAGWYMSAGRPRPRRQADPFHTGMPTSQSQPAERIFIFPSHCFKMLSKFMF